MTKTKSGVAIAATVAALFAGGAVIAPTLAHADGGVKCVGSNSCKGHSECATASNSCKGQNACKGQGWEKKASKAECEAAGGHVQMEEMKK